MLNIKKIKITNKQLLIKGNISPTPAPSGEIKYGAWFIGAYPLRHSPDGLKSETSIMNNLNKLDKIMFATTIYKYNNDGTGYWDYSPMIAGCESDKGNYASLFPDKDLYISVGGDQMKSDAMINENVDWTTLATDAVSKWNITGIDLDWEPTAPQAADYDKIVNIISTLKDNGINKIMLTVDAGQLYNWLPLFEATSLLDSIDYLSIMLYNTFTWYTMTTIDYFKWCISNWSGDSYDDSSRIATCGIGTSGQSTLIDPSGNTTLANNKHKLIYAFPINGQYDSVDKSFIEEAKTLLETKGNHGINFWYAGIPNPSSKQCSWCKCDSSDCEAVNCDTDSNTILQNTYDLWTDIIN